MIANKEYIKEIDNLLEYRTFDRPNESIIFNTTYFYFKYTNEEVKNEMVKIIKKCADTNYNEEEMDLKEFLKHFAGVETNEKRDYKFFHFELYTGLGNKINDLIDELKRFWEENNKK